MLLKCNWCKKIFLENNQSEGWKLHVFKNNAKVARLSRVVNDRVIMYPQWEKLKFTIESGRLKLITANEIIEPDTGNRRKIRVLMRGSQSPFDNFSPLRTIISDKIWNNIGNLLFPFSIIKNILSEDVIVDIYSKKDPADADFINENYLFFIDSSGKCF